MGYGMAIKFKKSELITLQQALISSINIRWNYIHQYCQKNIFYEFDPALNATQFKEVNSIENLSLKINNIIDRVNLTRYELTLLIQVSNDSKLPNIDDIVYKLSCLLNIKPLPCPFCGNVPEPELFSHNSIKLDSYFIICDCGKAQVRDYENINEAIKEWNDRV